MIFSAADTALPIEVARWGVVSAVGVSVVVAVQAWGTAVLSRRAERRTEPIKATLGVVNEGSGTIVQILERMETKQDRHGERVSRMEGRIEEIVRQNNESHAALHRRIDRVEQQRSVDIAKEQSLFEQLASKMSSG